MLTISKPLFAGQARSYHQKEFTAKQQNYWSQRGVVAGEWQGRLAPQLGLARTVSAEDFAKLSQGQHPQTGEQVVRQRASYEYQDADGNSLKMMEHRAGWDATGSAPKSVSLAALVGTDEGVREAHRESVRVALDQVEHHPQARIGGKHPPEATGKLIAATFERDTARLVDGYVAPQLSVCGVVFDITERDNGQPRAIQPQSLASQQFATAVYQSELTNRLRQLGYEITTGRSGAPVIKGYTAGYLDISSPRSQQIREYLEPTDRSGREAAETAAHSARDHKEIHSPREVIAAHRKLAAEFGYQAHAARERPQLQDKAVNSFDRVRESLTFSRAKNFEREAVVDERALIRDGLSQGALDRSAPLNAFKPSRVSRRKNVSIGEDNAKHQRKKRRIQPHHRPDCGVSGERRPPVDASMER
jgi:conjugative relaxase-like TrwC/TraI family protein